MADAKGTLARLDVLTRHLTSAGLVSDVASSSTALPDAADLEKFLVRDNAELRQRIYEFLKVRDRDVVTTLNMLLYALYARQSRG